MTKTKIAKVPEPVLNKNKAFSEALKVPTTKGFLLREKFIQGQFIATKKKKKNGTKKSKEVFEIEFL